MLPQTEETTASAPQLAPLAVRIPVAAEMLSIARTQMYDLIRQGKIPGFKVAGQMRVRVCDLEKYLAAQVAARQGE